MEMKELDHPILYSFRRCPYAMRARLSLLVSNQRVEIREVYLREKPQEFLKSSKSATVPCLVTNQENIDESLDIMIWALKLNDPYQWLKMPKLGYDFISQNDGPFKLALDRTKYHSRYPNVTPIIGITRLRFLVWGSTLFSRHGYTPFCKAICLY